MPRPLSNEEGPIASRRVDPESEAMINQGVNLGQICRLFSVDSRDVKKKISGQVAPTAMRGGVPIYKLKDVAPFLVTPPYDIDEFIQRMSIADLPTVLRKEFWAGMRSRQLYEKEAAELWETSQVVDTIAELMKTVRMSLLLSREQVERETELTSRQRDIIVKVVDHALEEAHTAVERCFRAVKEKASEEGSGETSSGQAGQGGATGTAGPPDFDAADSDDDL